MPQTDDTHDRTFADNRDFLYSLAYRMLGSAADAEDLVQDCYLRWRQVPPGSVESPRAYLASAITRLCINYLQSARVRRESYVGPWLPEPLVTAEMPDPAELAESLTIAFLVLLETLSPVERAVFLLGEVFGYSAEEAAEIVGKSAANCRQILHRARAAVAERKPRYMINQEAVKPLLDEFGKAVMKGDVSALMSMLHSDAVVYSDAGGKAVAATNPVRGADRVARFLTGIAAKGAASVRSVWTEINREPGAVNYRGSEILNTFVFHVEDGKVRDIYITINPDKLRKLKEEFHAS